MQLVGDRVSKIEASREEILEKPLKIKTDIDIIDIEKKELYSAEEKKEGLIFNYKFEVTYGDKPSAKILVEGAVFAIGFKKELEDTISTWKKDKKLASQQLLPAMNRAMELGYLSAIPVAKELKLPTPLRLPKFVVGEAKKEEKETVSSG